MAVVAWALDGRVEPGHGEIRERYGIFARPQVTAGGGGAADTTA